MNKIVSLKAIDKITKGQVLPNRKGFKKDINQLRQWINQYRQCIKDDDVFISERAMKDSILDVVDMIRAKYNITDKTILNILQVNSNFFWKLRRDCNRLLHKRRTTLLKDRLMYIQMIKNGLATRTEVARMAGVTRSVVTYWVQTDERFGLHLDKAIAFRHDTI